MPHRRRAPPLPCCSSSRTTRRSTRPSPIALWQKASGSCRRSTDQVRSRPTASTLPTSSSSTSCCPASTGSRSAGASRRSGRSRCSCSRRGLTRPTCSSASGSARGSEVHLTPLEFDLLLALAAEPGAVRGRDELMREVWGWADAGGTRTLDSHVKSLRAKIGADRVRTVHGVGYSLEAVEAGEAVDHDDTPEAPDEARP